MNTKKIISQKDKWEGDIILFLRLWCWAAMHSPDFHEFQLHLDPPLLTIKLATADWTFSHLATIHISVWIPRLCLDMPEHVIEKFVHSMKSEGEIIEFWFDDGIPF